MIDLLLKVQITSPRARPSAFLPKEKKKKQTRAIVVTKLLNVGSEKIVVKRSKHSFSLLFLSRAACCTMTKQKEILALSVEKYV